MAIEERLAELEARLVRAFAFWKSLRDRQFREWVGAVMRATVAAMLALAATLAASTAVAVLEAAKLNQVGTDG